MGTRNLRKQVPSRKWLSLPIAILLILVSLSDTTALSQTSNDGPVARMTVTTTRIRWRPLVENDGLVLTVAGPGEIEYQQEFAPGRVPSFGLISSERKRYPDGMYTYVLGAGFFDSESGYSG